jgi:succinyl-diaminopimelate desuccinylase
MVILKTLHEAGVRFPGTLMLQAPMGEEMDEPGTRTLLQKGYTGDYAIVLEPTGLRIGPASRGVSWFEITLSGPSLHCGLADAEGPDVMASFARIATALTAYHHQVAAIEHPLSPSPSCRITRVEAGEAHNSLVGRCTFVVDRRMIPGETVAQVESELRQIIDGVLAGAPDIAYQLAFIEWNEPVQAPLDSPLIAALNGMWLRSAASNRRFGPCPMAATCVTLFTMPAFRPLTLAQATIAFATSRMSL